MNIKLIPRGTEGEFLLIGRLDSNTSPEVEKILVESSERFEKIVLNFKELSYISSAGLRVLKIMHMQMKKKNGTLVIRGCNKMVMEVFEMTGFAGLLHLE